MRILLLVLVALLVGGCRTVVVSVNILTTRSQSSSALGDALSEGTADGGADIDAEVPLR